MSEFKERLENYEENVPQEEGAKPDQNVDVTKEEEQAFPGGPTQSQIDEWKSRFADGIFMTEIDSEVFVWRPIRRMEYKNVMQIKNADAMFREEKICETCVLWPEDYDFTKMRQGKAGVPSMLVDQIMEKSGFSAEGQPQQL